MTRTAATYLDRALEEMTEAGTFTSKAAQKRADESLQLDIYALAHLRTKGRLPDRVELRFLESGLAAGRAPTGDDVFRTEERIRAAAEGIRGRDFPPRPTWMACGQCPFRDICPHTARGSERAERGVGGE